MSQQTAVKIPRNPNKIPNPKIDKKNTHYTYFIVHFCKIPQSIRICIAWNQLTNVCANPLLMDASLVSPSTVEKVTTTIDTRHMKSLLVDGENKTTSWFVGHWPRRVIPLITTAEYIWAIVNARERFVLPQNLPFYSHQFSPVDGYSLWAANS